MAFFGLTQLGPQSTFNANLVSLQNYTCFSEQDFRTAFGEAATVPLEKVGKCLIPSRSRALTRSRPRRLARSLSRFLAG
eukprot:COSAG01_NODE_8561_length_2741_cov_11.808100_1_plen_79_part_00